MKIEKTHKKTDVWSIVSPERKSLIRLRLLAIRNRSWFKVLSFSKRRFIDAVIQCVDRIRSNTLLSLLRPIVERLLKAIGGIQVLIGKIAYGMLSFGRIQAQRISKIALVWGNKHGEKWAKDEDFIRYLTIMELNNNSMFQISDTF